VKFKAGDKVIYPNHGLGIIEGIETKTILGTKGGFYLLRMTATDTTVMVPVTNVENVGLRRAIVGDEIEGLFSQLSRGKIDSHQNWKGRFKENTDKMRSGSIYDAVDVLKNLMYLSRSKNLSFREKRMLDRSKFLVITEIAEVGEIEESVVEERVNSALEKCFAAKKRAIARREKAAKTAKSTARVGSRRTKRTARAS
jgi:CarD family transcriptional regulator